MSLVKQEGDGRWGVRDGVSGQQGPWCQAPRMPVAAGPCAELGAGHGVRVRQVLRILLGGLAVHQERQTHRHTVPRVVVSRRGALLAPRLLVGVGFLMP